MEFKGTSGEWVRVGPFILSKSNHTTICTLGAHGDELIANAKIITSAPILLKELMDVRMALIASNNPADKKIIESIESAIKKAL